VPTGLIDQVRIYDYARTPAQIAWDYNKGKPVGHWKMDENQGMTVHDSSGNGNDGTMTDMDPATDWVDGRKNKALDFDGSNDYINVGNAMPTGAYSKTAWIKRRTGSNMNNIISGSTQHAFWAPVSYGSICAFCLAAGHTSPFDAVYDSEPIEVDIWYFVAVTYDPDVNSGEMRLYKSGIEVDSATGVTANTDTVFNIGRWGSGYTFNGQIDDVKVFNYALTAEQIKAEYTSGAVSFR
jgi:hypothetical protein